MRSILLLLLVLVSCWAADGIKIPKGAVQVGATAALLDGLWRIDVDGSAGRPDPLSISCTGQSLSCSFGDASWTGSVGKPISFFVKRESGEASYEDGKTYRLKDGSIVIIGVVRTWLYARVSPTTGGTEPEARETKKWTAHSRKPRE
jgi:hypothetical protein